MAGLSMLPSVFLSSCFQWRGGGQELLTDYIGSQEKFGLFQHYFKNIKKSRFAYSSLEASLSNDSNIVLLDTDSGNKSSYAIMLLEKGKDIITTYPLCNTLTGYASISDFAEKYDRMVGLLNPLAFYPSIQSLKEIIIEENILIDKVRISCHPSDLSAAFSVSGLAGTAQPLQRIISYISNSFPVSLLTESKDNAQPAGIRVNFENFETLILFDKKQAGWIMELSGADFSALTDHTGLLALNSEVEPRIAPDPAVMENAIRANLEDFMQSARERTEPRVNSLDGLASIILNKAVEESLQTGSTVNL